MVTPSRLWRPLILALHELTIQSDRLARALADAEGRPESENAESYAATSADPDALAASASGAWPAAASPSTSESSAASDSGPADPAAKYAAPEGRGDGAAAEGNPFYKASAASEGARSQQASRHAASEVPRPSRVSVLLPVKNGLPLLHDAIASLVAQTHPDVEILVIDDGSTDGGPQEVVAQALSHVRVVKSNGQGVAAALNAGLRAATGAFIARQDADDWSHPERLARQFEYLSQHADVDVLATCAEFVDREGRPVETSWTMGVRREQDTAQTAASLADLLPVRSALVHGSIMARRDVLREAGGYRPQAVYAEDYDLWLRLLPKARFAKLPTRLYTYRLHDVTVSQQYRDIQQRSTIRAKLEYLQRRYPDLPSNPRLLLAGEQRDLAAWREIASDLKFAIAATTLPAYPDSLASATLRAALDDADVVAIADLDALVDWIARMEEHAQFVREGNFFLRS
jgi:hypothetical protein